MTRTTRLRAAILGITCGIAVLIVSFAFYVDQSSAVAIRTLGLCSIGLLYLTLLITPLITLFPGMPLKGSLVLARRPLGVSAFLFALLHASIAFFIQLGGFAGLPFLPQRYVTGITLSFIALCILTVMAATSFDFAVRALGRRWKMVHRFVYVAAFLIVAHVLILGSNFSSTGSDTYRISYFLFFVLLGLEAVRLDRAIEKAFNAHARAGLALCLVLSFASFTLARFDGQGGESLFSVHSQHVKIAEDAQQNAISTSAIPGFSGDRTKRYSVGLAPLPAFKADAPLQIRFGVTDAITGETQTRFTKFYAQFVHVIIVDDSLRFFLHTHPTAFENGQFVVEASLPAAGRYHMYLNFQPYGAIEQSFAFALPFGDSAAADPVVVADASRVGTAGGYQVALTTPSTISASEASVGKAEITFSVSKDGTPSSDLRQYLEAFGHLTLVDTSTYEFLHVHPSSVPASATETSGPEVRFLPLGLYGPIRPGTYRAFAEFNPGGTYVMAPFTLKIQ